MNRLQPCDDCGCPIVYHRAGPPGPDGRAAMVCDECSRTQGRPRVCAAPPGSD